MAVERGDHLYEGERREPERLKLVTPRPGRGAWLLIGYAVLLLVMVNRIQPLGADTKEQWDDGTPVLLQIVGRDEDGRVVLEEYGGGSRWTTSADDVPTTTPSGGIQARFVGPDRQVMFAPIESNVPGWFGFLPLVLIGMAVPGLLARSRWRGLGRVLATQPRRVKLEPAWVRGARAPRLAVKVRDVAAAPGDAASDVIVEVKGTPVTWWALAVQDSTQEALAYGPDSSGLMVLETDSGRAVPSSSPRRGDRVKATVCSWSDRLAVEIGLLEPPAATLTFGGTGRQRVSVSGNDGSVALGHGPQQSYAMDMGLVRRRMQMYPFLISIVVLVLVLVVRSSTFTPLLYVSGFVAVELMRWSGARAMTTRSPLAAWKDRRAAREAGHAAFALGLRPATPAEVG